jgi:hypothetical protein
MSKRVSPSNKTRCHFHQFLHPNYPKELQNAKVAGGLYVKDVTEKAYSDQWLFLLSRL